jgi:hypothetical protein
VVSGVAFILFVVFWVFLRIIPREHELGHVLACQYFGVPVYEATWDFVLHGIVSNPYVAFVINFSGGLLGCIFSVLVLLIIKLSSWMIDSFQDSFPPTLTEAMALNPCSPWALVEGAYVAFLGFAFEQLVNAVWEGFFNANYLDNYKNEVLGVPIFLGSFIVAWLIVFIRTRHTHTFGAHY